MKRLALLFAILICGIATSSAQKVAIKTNALYDATATINLGAEFGLHPRWTLDISGNFNSWSKNKGGESGSIGLPSLRPDIGSVTALLATLSVRIYWSEPLISAASKTTSAF